MYILKTKLPELIFPDNIKNAFKIILKLKHKQEQLLNVLQGRPRFISITLHSAAQVQHSIFKFYIYQI